MPLPYYVSPEQMMKDKAEYARKGISRGRSLVTLECGDGRPGRRDPPLPQGSLPGGHDPWRRVAARRPRADRDPEQDAHRARSRGRGSRPDQGAAQVPAHPPGSARSTPGRGEVSRVRLGQDRPMKRRIFGLENEYGLTCTLNGQRRLSPDNVARYLFEKVIPGARNANVFLEKSARLDLET